jgi:hypothetical protein
MNSLNQKEKASKKKLYLRYPFMLGPRRSTHGCIIKFNLNLELRRATTNTSIVHDTEQGSWWKKSGKKVVGCIIWSMCSVEGEKRFSLIPFRWIFSQSSFPIVVVGSGVQWTGILNQKPVLKCIGEILKYGYGRYS